MVQPPESQPQSPAAGTALPTTEAMPLLSIITPVYNAQATLPRTLASFDHIPAEHRDGVQLVLVDDGSTDRSPALLDAFAAAHTFGDVKVIHQANGGTASARNTAINAARGTWLFFLDADDELAFNPVPALLDHADATAIGFTVRFEKQGKTLRTWKPPRVTPQAHRRVFTGNCVVCTCNLLFKRECIDHPFDEQFPLLEDWHWWLINPRIFDRMKVFPETTSAIVHVHGGNKTSQYDTRGRCRIMIADDLLARWSGELTVRQRHNLQLQKACGKLQMGQRVGVANLLRWPCSWLLYIKFLVYFALRRNVAKIEMYS